MTPPPSPDRRTARTRDALVALSRLFEATRRRGGLTAIVLSDDSGLPIAGAGPHFRCEELAARCAFLESARPANDTVPCRLDVVIRTARVRRLSIDGIEVLLCAEAEGEAEGEGRSLDHELEATAAGCSRILGDGARRRGMACGPRPPESPASDRFDIAKRG